MRAYSPMGKTSEQPGHTTTMAALIANDKTMRTTATSAAKRNSRIGIAAGEMLV